MINLIISAVFLVYVARRLGDAGFGIYAFALSFASIFIILSDFGLHTTLAKEIVKDKARTSLYTGNVIILKMALIGLSLLLMWITSFVLNYSLEKTGLLFLMAIFVLCTSVLDFYNAIYRAYESMQYESVIMLLDRLSIAGCGILILYFSQNLLHFLWGIVLANLAWAIVGGMLIVRLYGRPVFQIDFRLIKNFLRYAAPVGLMIICTTLYLKADTVILERIQGDAVVGWYNVPHRLIEILFSFATFFSAAIFPSFINAFRDSESSLSTLYANSVRFVAIIGLPGALGVTLWGDEIIRIVFGPQYTESAIALKLLIWAGVMGCVNIVTRYLLIAVDLQRLNGWLLGLCAIMNILLNCLLIPIFSYKGACLALFITEGLYWCLAYVVLNRKFFVDNLLNNLSRPVLAVAITSVVVWFMRGAGNIFLALLFIVTYILCLVLLRGVTHNDGQYVKSLLRASARRTT